MVIKHEMARRDY